MTQSVTAPVARPSRPATSPIIEIEGLVKRYKDFTAVNGIDLQVRAGEIFGILGPNGAGKTTTLEMIEGLRTPDAGTIRVAGLDAVRDSEQVRRIIGVQLQSTALFPYLNATELIELFGNFYGVPNPRERAPELLRLVDLEEKATARVDELSGGQQQRLSIALALVNTPKITFLDEPTTGLDPHARRNLWQTILGVRDAGTTVVLTTHYMEEAEVLCDRIAIMDGGQVIACDTPTGLIRALSVEATVSATIAGDHPEGITVEDLTAIPGVTQATITTNHPSPVIKAQTSDVQATIVGLLQLAGQRGITLGELTSTRANLEDVFLSLTGRSYAQDDAPPDEDAAPKKRRGRGRDR
ncbi:MAG TPA: ABC transporter ATP-binding protein [Thermomicrobiales bacterium]|nr:ABC transporter ATP-binding protein [Thermomicrobiales bacterium]